MQRLYEISRNVDCVQSGVIGVRTKKLFFFPPLTDCSFEGDDTQPKTLNSSLSSVDCLSLSHDERTLAYTGNSVIKLLDLNTGREQRTLIGHNQRVNEVVQSNRSIYLWASVSADFSVILWDVRQHPANVQTRRFDHAATCLKFSPDDAFIAVGSDHLYIVNQRSRDITVLQSSSQVTHICFHPSEYLMAVGSEDRLIKFWDIDSRECVSQSESFDGPLRGVLFNKSGTCLISVTNRRCRAISWEPFDILAQNKLEEVDKVLKVAVDDSYMYLLGASSSKATVGMYSFDLMNWLNTGGIQDEVLSEPPVVSKEFSCAAYDQPDEKKQVSELTVTCSSDDEVFTSARALINNISPDSIPTAPRKEKFVVSMNRCRPSCATNLKAKRLEPKPKANVKVQISKCGPRLTRTKMTTMSTPNVRLHSTSSVKDHPTPSALYVTPVEQNFEAEVKLNKGCRISSSKRNNVDAANEDCVLNMIKDEHSKILETLIRRRELVDSLRQTWRSRGVEAALSDAVKTNDVAVLVELIFALNQSPSTWNLSVCSIIVPHLSLLITAEKERYVEVALVALRTVINGFGHQLRVFAQSISNIGVDVAAEERRLRSTRCIQHLTEIRVKSTLFTDLLNPQHAREFNVLMQIFDDTVSLV